MPTVPMLNYLTNLINLPYFRYTEAMPMQPENEAAMDYSAPPAKKRSLGQNFLKDKGIASRIVGQLDIQPGDNILEIGPGAGALTQYIKLKQPARLLLLEKDRYWAAWHGQITRAKNFNCQPILMDALLFSWKRLEGQWKIVGNLPYNVASPLVWDILQQATACKLALFMVQKEVGQRMASPPGSREYGALSVWVQSFAKVKKLFIVPPGAFEPKPKIDSMVIELTPGEQNLHCSPEALSGALKICFQQRRKQIKNILKNFWSDCLEDFFGEEKLSPGIRPECLTPKQFQKLAKILFINKTS